MFGNTRRRENKRKQLQYTAMAEARSDKAQTPWEKFEAETGKTANDVHYLHLRCWSIEDKSLYHTGGVTLAYVRVGDWYRVGTAFCSLKDTYCRDGVVKGKPVGRRLAVERLLTDYCWVPWWHLCGDYEFTTCCLDNAAGRAWVSHAMRHGLGLEWFLAPRS